MPETLAIGVDAGGTKIEGLLVDVGLGKILDRRLVETPAADAEATARAIVAVARELMAGRDAVRALGVGAAGMVDRGGVMRYAPSVAWRDFHLSDRVAVRILGEVGRRLGEGIAGLVNVLDPDLVVVGGGAIAAGELLLQPARRAFIDSVEAPDHRPDVPIVPAALANDAGSVGAADLACQEVGGG